MLKNNGKNHNIKKNQVPAASFTEGHQQVLHTQKIVFNYIRHYPNTWSFIIAPTSNIQIITGLPIFLPGIRE